VIPVAIGAVVLGPVGGAVAGAIFGLTSFLQCIGVGGSSAMGVVLFGINPVFAFIQRFIPRLLDGICLGYIFKGMRKVSNTYVACAVTGFFSAFLNTLFFMSALVGLFGNTDYVKNLMGGHGIADLSHAFKNVSETDTVQKTWDESLDKGKYRIDQRSMRNDFLHSDHRSSGSCTFQGTSDPIRTD